jgi:hypothetical protein
VEGGVLSTKLRIFMDNIEKIVVGVFTRRENAEEAIAGLRDAGIKDNDISYVYSSEGEVVTEEGGGNKVGGGAAAGAGTGAVLGGIAGLVVAAGILPGVGALFVAGPLASALGLSGAAATAASGALTGAAAGGIIGGLTGLGIKEDEAKIYEERIRLGSVLITARTNEPQKARDVMERNGAEEIRDYIAS